MTVFFDGIIALVVAGVPLFCLFVWRKRKIMNSGTIVLAFFFVIIWLVVFYGSFIEPRILITKIYPITLGSTQHHLRAAVVSDFHLGIYRHSEWVARVVERINAKHPDIVFLVGDFVSNAAGIEELRPLMNLKSRYGTYAAVGNWDYRVGEVDVRKKLGSLKVRVLTNISLPVFVDGKEVRIIGLDDLQYGHPDWDMSMKDVPANAMTILLSHNPDAASLAEVNHIKLVVSGHTHGGQIRLPFIGSVPPLPTKLGQRFDKGLFSFGPTQLFITSGVGELGSRARFLNPPEVSLLEITF